MWRHSQSKQVSKMTDLTKMTIEQITNANLSDGMKSDFIEAKVIIEVKGQVLNYLRAAHDSWGFDYTESDVESIASESAHEVRRELDGIHSPDESLLKMLSWKVSAYRCATFIHGA